MVIKVAALAIANYGVFTIREELVASEASGLVDLLDIHVTVGAIHDAVVARDELGELVSVGAVVGNGFDISDRVVNIIGSFFDRVGDFANAGRKIAR
jgi:hypothetical protein